MRAEAQPKSMSSNKSLHDSSIAFSWPSTSVFSESESPSRGRFMLQLRPQAQPRSYSYRATGLLALFGVSGVGATNTASFVLNLHLHYILIVQTLLSKSLSTSKQDHKTRCNCGHPGPGRSRLAQVSLWEPEIRQLPPENKARPGRPPPNQLRQPPEAIRSILAAQKNERRATTTSFIRLAF